MSNDRNSPAAGQSRPLDEQTPLLPAAGQSQGAPSEAHSRQSVQPIDETQNTKSIGYLILLTIGIGGLQIAWTVELSNGSPYLLSLGISKSFMALVWIAGPLTGTLVQPYMGMLSDSCRSPMGKRKPFIWGGTAATIVSLMCLAWVKEIVNGLLGLVGADPDSQNVRNTVIVLAVVGIYVLDVAINTVQATIRAFIVDCTPAHQQEAANAMASRIIGFGNIFGYIAGYVDLPKHLWFLGNNQFKVLCVVASFALAFTVAISTASISEQDPRIDGPAAEGRQGLLTFFLTIFTSIRRLPVQIKRVCQVQFFAWIGFFPFLFYTSSYIGELYVEPFLEKNPHMTAKELDRLYEKGTRVGTFALLINAVVSLATNVLLPFFIAPTYDKQNPIAPSRDEVHTGDAKSGSGEWVRYLQIPGFTLKRAWLGSLILFCVAMVCTVMVRSVRTATVLIGIVGVTWAMTLWAPWAIISAEISRRDAIIRARRAGTVSRRTASQMTGSVEVHDHGDTNGDDEVDQAGVILGIHNMAVAAPQMIATFVSSIVFRLWQKPRGTPGDYSMPIVFAFGGLCVLVASTFVVRIEENTSVAEEPGAAAAEAGQGQTRGPDRKATARHAFAEE